MPPVPDITPCYTLVVSVPMAYDNRRALLNREERLAALTRSLGKLTESQMFWIENVMRQFSNPTDHRRDPDSDLVTTCVLDTFSDALQIHHAFSRAALSKDTFEYTLERTLNLCGV